MKTENASIREPLLLTRRETAERYRIGCTTLDWLRTQGLPCHLVGRRKVMFRPEETDKWMLSRGGNQAAA